MVIGDARRGVEALPQFAGVIGVGNLAIVVGIRSEAEGVGWQNTGARLVDVGVRGLEMPGNKTGTDDQILILSVPDMLDLPEVKFGSPGLIEIGRKT